MDAQEITKEEIAARKQQMMDFYNEQLPFLKVQAEYETLTATIEKARYEKLVCLIKTAEMTNLPDKNEKEKEDTDN